MTSRSLASSFLASVFSASASASAFSPSLVSFSVEKKREVWGANGRRAGMRCCVVRRSASDAVEGEVERIERAA